MNESKCENNNEIIYREEKKRNQNTPLQLNGPKTLASSLNRSHKIRND